MLWTDSLSNKLFQSHTDAKVSALLQIYCPALPPTPPLSSPLCHNSQKSAYICVVRTWIRRDNNKTEKTSSKIFLMQMFILTVKNDMYVIRSLNSLQEAPSSAREYLFREICHPMPPNATFEPDKRTKRWAPSNKHYRTIYFTAQFLI